MPRSAFIRSYGQPTLYALRNSSDAGTLAARHKRSKASALTARLVVAAALRCSRDALIIMGRDCGCGRSKLTESAANCHSQ